MIVHFSTKKRLELFCGAKLIFYVICNLFCSNHFLIRCQRKVLLHWLQFSLKPDCKNLGSGFPSLIAADKPCLLLEGSWQAMPSITTFLTSFSQLFLKVAKSPKLFSLSSQLLKLRNSLNFRCDYSAKDKSSLDYHIKSGLKSEEVQKCLHCEFKSCTTYGLANHVKISHPEFKRKHHKCERYVICYWAKLSEIKRDIEVVPVIIDKILIGKASS